MKNQREFLLKPKASKQDARCHWYHLASFWKVSAMQLAWNDYPKDDKTITL